MGEINKKTRNFFEEEWKLRMIYERSGKVKSMLFNFH
jgi:hypothetical protein